MIAKLVTYETMHLRTPADVGVVVDFPDERERTKAHLRSGEDQAVQLRENRTVCVWGYPGHPDGERWFVCDLQNVQEGDIGEVDEFPSLDEALDEAERRAS